MRAPLVDRLESQISTCSVARTKACLRAELGIYFTRTEQHSVATEIAVDIRKSYGRGEDAEVYIWLAMLEGLICFYQSATTKNKEKVLRAHAIARALGRVDLEQYAAAWLAHHSFNEGDYASMARWLTVSRLEQAARPSAAIRSCLTVADGLQLIGENKTAAFWYSKARRFAAQEGDRASIMASIENRAAMRLDILWLNTALGNSGAGDVLEIESELLGGLRYEKFTRSDSLVYQEPIWRARIESIKGNYNLALDILRQSVVDITKHEISLVAACGADMAWLCYCTGALAEAREQFSHAIDSTSQSLDSDDAAIYWKRMSMLDERLFDGRRVAEFETNARMALDRYQISIANLVASLSSVVIIPSRNDGFQNEGRFDVL